MHLLRLGFIVVLPLQSRGLNCSPVAQLLVHGTNTAKVMDSIPTGASHTDTHGFIRRCFCSEPENY